MTAQEIECKRKFPGGDISLFITPILTVVGIALVSLLGWLLFTTYFQAQDLSEIERDSTYYLQQIDENTQAIDKLSSDFVKLSSDFKDLRAEVLQWNSKVLEWNRDLC